MKAITLYQPFAGFVALGWKTLATRSWRTDYRGTIAVHAARCHVPGVYSAALRRGWLRPFGQPHGATAARLCNVQGAIVCTAILADCRRMHPEDEPAAIAAWQPKLWAWVLSDVFVLPEPLAALGPQGLWDVRGTLEDRLYAMHLDRRPSSSC
jgi:hypothetical protein